MPVVIGIVIFLAVCWMFPRLILFCFVTPIAAFVLGGFLWALGALYDKSLNNLDTFCIFVGVAWIASAFYFMKDTA
jgi:hypothetical protein